MDLRKKLTAAFYAEPLFSLLELRGEQILMLKEELERRDLEHVRNLRDLIENFRDAMELGEPTLEVLEAIEAAIEDLSDEVARRSEHIA